MPSDAEIDKQAARLFFEGLKEHLNRDISLPAIKQWVQKKKNSAPKGKGVNYEMLFLDEFVLPRIPEYLVKELGLLKESAREAFLAESTVARRQGLTSDSPRSANKYLFTKV